jgi:hypothetical protein
LAFKQITDQNLFWHVFSLYLSEVIKQRHEEFNFGLRIADLIKAHRKDAKYGKLKQRKGHNTAKVVLVREMLKIIYHVLKERRPFYSDKEEYQIQSVAAPALCGV